MKRIALAILFVFTPLLAEAQQTIGITPCSANTISATTTSSNILLSNCGPTVIVWNVGSQEAFYLTGTASSTAATTASYSVPGTSFVVLNVGAGTTPYLAAITASSATTLRITQGYAK